MPDSAASSSSLPCVSISGISARATNGKVTKTDASTIAAAVSASLKAAGADLGERHLRRLALQDEMRAVLRERSDVPLLDPTVSRRHASLVADDSGIELNDLGSSNGTFVNGQRVETARVAAGDVLTFGKLSFQPHVLFHQPPVFDCDCHLPGKNLTDGPRV